MLDLNHKRLDVWKLAISFVSDMYTETDGYPRAEMYGLANQLRRAAVSIPSNIADGASRKSPGERKRFYEIARSSLVEIDTQLEIAAHLNYRSEESIPPQSETINHLFAMLSKLIKNTN